MSAYSTCMYAANLAMQKLSRILSEVMNLLASTVFIKRNTGGVS